MTAPALIALAHGSADPRSAATINSLVDLVAQSRPELRIEAAFADLSTPTLDDSIDAAVADGHREIVVVPLRLSHTDPAGQDFARLIEKTRTRHSRVEIGVTEDLGVHQSFFGVLDRRLREALKANRVQELDALVLAAEGSSDHWAQSMITRAARAWGTHHHLPVIAAFASTAPPSTGEAVRAHRADGRRHIAVGSLFLTHGPMQSLVSELALEAGAVAVADPLGVDVAIADVILARYAVGAVELVPLFV